jgi:hypothetical protein
VQACVGGSLAGLPCEADSDCPSSTCNTTTFANETANVVYTAGGTGDNVSTTATATVSFTSPYLTLYANSGNAKFRWIFNTATPIWIGTTTGKQSVLEADICLSQISNLCSPSCITNIRLEP